MTAPSFLYAFRRWDPVQKPKLHERSHVEATCLRCSIRASATFDFLAHDGWYTSSEKETGTAYLCPSCAVNERGGGTGAPARGAGDGGPAHTP